MRELEGRGHAPGRNEIPIYSKAQRQLDGHGLIVLAHVQNRSASPNHPLIAGLPGESDARADIVRSPVVGVGAGPVAPSKGDHAGSTGNRVDNVWIETILLLVKFVTGRVQ